MVNIWYTVNRRISTTKVGRKLAQESTAAADILELVLNLDEADRHILFPQTTETPIMG